MGQFISAGHNPAYLFRSATGKIERLLSDAFFLGMFDFATYESRPFHLDKGDILVVISDGLTDAQNPKQEMFGEEGCWKSFGKRRPREVPQSSRNSCEPSRSSPRACRKPTTSPSWWLKSISKRPALLDYRTTVIASPTSGYLAS